MSKKRDRTGAIVLVGALVGAWFLFRMQSPSRLAPGRQSEEAKAAKLAATRMARDPAFVEDYSVAVWSNILETAPDLPPWSALAEAHKQGVREVAEQTARDGRNVYMDDLQHIIDSVRAEAAERGAGS